MSEIKDAAISYAEQGWPVLPVYGMKPDPDTGIWRCLCRIGGTGQGVPNCKPGKHAYFEGRGAHDATTDVEAIATWAEDCNVAIAGRDTFPLIDIDDPAIVQALLDPDIGLRDLCTVSTTGRGLHLYVQCAPTVSGILKKTTGERIGEMRAYGQYVVAPPSMHHTGRAYAWLGAAITDGVSSSQKDGYGYIAEVLSWVGVEIMPRREAGTYVPREGSIPPVSELPFSTQSGMLASMLHETYLVGDRSTELYKLACEIYREINANSLDVQDVAIAGVLKHADIDRGSRHPKGAKYAGRENADDYYWGIVQDAKRVVQQDATAVLAPIIAEETNEPEPERPSQGTYYFVEKPPQFIDNRNPRRPKLIANFEPTMLEHIHAWKGEEETRDPVVKWAIRVRQGETEKIVSLSPSEYGDSSSFHKGIRQKLTNRWIIEEDAKTQLLNAMLHHTLAYHRVQGSETGEAPTRRAYAFTGWIPERDAFVLPGGAGSVTPSGIDESLRYEPVDAGEPWLYQYGWNVNPAASTDLPSLLRMLYTVRRPEIIVPVLTQTFAATLASLGAGREATALHIIGGTGSFKTTLARMALSPLGRFVDTHSDRIFEWNLTTTSLQIAMHEARDLPLIVDDYKVSRIEDRSAKALVTMIQNYADRTARSRATADQKLQESQYPRALLISTGEDVWEGQESLDARTLIVDASASGEDREALKRRSNPVLDAARSGSMGMVGFEWLRWATERGRTWIEAELKSRFDKRKESRSFDHELHSRKVSSLAMLISVSSLIRDFIQDRAPEFLEDYAEMERLGWTRLIAQEVERSRLSLGSTPYETLVDAILAAITVGEAYLQPRLHDGSGIGMQGAPVVGYVDHEYVWLNDEITLGWFRSRKRREGDSRTPVPWKTLLREAQRDHQGHYPNYAVSIAGHGVNLKDRRMVGIPRAEFFANAPASLVESLEGFE